MSLKCCFQKKLWHQGRIIQRFLSSDHNQERPHKDRGTDPYETHFGFKTVTEKEKEEKVYEVFRNVADRYDTMNDAMSIGIHRLWKDYFIHRLCPRPRMHLLDVAGGTGNFGLCHTEKGARSMEDNYPSSIRCIRGDIAFRFLRYVESLSNSVERTDFSDSKLDLSRENHIVVNEDEANSGKEPERDPSKTHVTVVDINQSMLDVGKQRARDAGIRSGVSWLCANAESLPLPDSSYDAYTIAFGIRNCTHVDKVLTEAHRVLKPGGKFFCLEFSHVSNPVIRKLYDSYSFQVIPVLGKIIAGDWHSYQYLVESIRRFPFQEEFKKMIEKADFSEVKHENLSLGIAAIHSGIKS